MKQWLHVNGVSMTKESAARSTNRIKAIDEISWGIRRIRRLPAQLSGVGGAIGLIKITNKATVRRRTGMERLVSNRRLDSIQPTAEIPKTKSVIKDSSKARGRREKRETSKLEPALIKAARGGEGSAGDLLGVEAKRAEKRVVLVGGECTGLGLGGEVVAEARVVVKIDPGGILRGLSVKAC